MDTLTTYGAIISFVKIDRTTSAAEYMKLLADAFTGLSAKMEHFGVTQADIEHIAIGPEEPFGDGVKSICITVELNRDIAHPDELERFTEDRASTLGLTYTP